MGGVVLMDLILFLDRPDTKPVRTAAAVLRIHVARREVQEVRVVLAVRGRKPHITEGTDAVQQTTRVAPIARRGEEYTCSITAISFEPIAAGEASYYIACRKVSERITIRYMKANRTRVVHGLYYSIVTVTRRGTVGIP